MEWMAWTLPTAGLFAGLAALLVGMTVWEWRSPSRQRKGWLPMPTTRGDRLFLGLVATAVLHLAWVGFTDQHVGWAAVPSLLLIVLLMRRG